MTTTNPMVEEDRRHAKKANRVKVFFLSIIIMILLVVVVVVVGLLFLERGAKIDPWILDYEERILFVGWVV